MYDKQVVRRRRAVLAVLVALSIILLTGYFGEGSGGFFHGIQHGAQVVLSPIEAGANRAFKPVRDLVSWVGGVFSANGENKRLKKELASERALLAKAQTAAHDDPQLRAMLGLPQTSGFPPGPRLTARVIVRSPSVWFSTVEIDKGFDDGVRVNQPVVTGGGLAGKVTAVTPGTAVVTLITDASSAVSAEVEPEGAGGVVRPAIGDPNDLRVEFIQKGAKINKGDTVITSGFTSERLESLFPRGIPVGRVTRVNADELEVYQLVHIQPFVDFHKIDYVQVLTSRPRVSQAELDLNAPQGGP